MMSSCTKILSLLEAGFIFDLKGRTRTKEWSENGRMGTEQEMKDSKPIDSSSHEAVDPANGAS